MFRRSMVSGGAWLALILIVGQLSAAPAKYRNFNLPCLAPLLRQVDSEAPRSVNVAFLRGPWRAPKERTALGSVHFPITTESPESRKWFNQGVALLHAQANAEAERAFRQALLMDAENPMIFWGLALANEQRPGRARLFALNAVRRVGNTTTQRERAWIRVLQEFHELDHDSPLALPAGWSQRASVHPERHRQRIRNLESLVVTYPEDLEAKAFLLRQLVLDLYRSKIPLTSYVGVDRLAQEIMDAAPSHPAVPYRLFLWLSERPGEALKHAETCVRIAPGNPDSWRFAAEAYRATGAQHEAISFLECAIRVHHREIRNHLILPEESANLASNYDALLAALLRMGRIAEALKWSDEILSLPVSLERDGVTKEATRFRSIAIRARALARLRQGKAGQLLDELQEARSLLPSRGNVHQAAQLYYWSGIAHGTRTQWQEAEASEKSLRELAESEPSDEQIRAWADGLRYVLTLAGGESAPEALHVPPYLPSDMHAAMWAKRGDEDRALRLVSDDLGRDPGALFATAAYCNYSWKAGKRSATTRAFDQRFRRNVLRADPALRKFSELDLIAGKLRLPRRWSLPASPGMVPGLPADAANLGPLHYSPPPAPAWTLANHAGRTVSLADFKGRAVLLNFFLGVSCPFCLNQLEKFRPALPRFRQAGIEMVAISSDDVETLAARLGKAEEMTPEARRQFPFPVLADPKLVSFRNYHVFDEFEGGPMHGTVLIGPSGEILWSDVGHEPFDHPEQLLAEAKRLLKVHHPGWPTPAK